ncbi:O-linked N-acetylglucosamine transferase SPINDLY family-like protein [Hyphomicrobium sp. 1Nfss2.1]
MWVTADAALLANDAKTAHDIYRQLRSRKPRTPYEFLFVGLAAYRLKDVALALNVLEAGHRRYPSMPDLTENFLRIAIERQQLDRALRSIDPPAGKVACERLIAQPLDWSTHVSLVVYLLRAGHWDFANARIDEIIRACDSTAENWRLSDILLKLRRKSDADRIYDKLSSRAAKNADDALYAALSLERLQAPEKAAARLEAELAKYPHVAYLREHFLRICFASGQVEKLAAFVEGEAGYPEAIEALFDRVSDFSQQFKLIEYYLKQGHTSIIRRKLCRDQCDGGYDSGVLWNIAHQMDLKGFADVAREVFQIVVDRPRRTSQDAYFAASSALRLPDLGLCLTILEDGLTENSSAAELRRLYLQISASGHEYRRYLKFMNSLSPEDGHDIHSVADFYRAAVSNQAPETFVINYRDIQGQCPPAIFSGLKSDVLSVLRTAPPPSAKARLLAFFTRYLDLEEEFAAPLAEMLSTQVEQMGGTRIDQRVIEMLLRLTPPMIAAESGRSERRNREFIEACRSVVLRPVELNEPIKDMSNNWTPWQFLFCSGVPQTYGQAMEAFERAAVKTWPRLNFTAEHIGDRDPQTRSGRRVRIGFVVHAAMPMMSGLLSGFDPAIFETVFLHPGKSGESRAAKNWISRAGRVVEYSDQDVYEAIDTIAAEKLDIIVSGPSVAAVFFPMMARLAHLQMVLLEPNWTDGFTNADFYVSWRPAEPTAPEEFYKTKVALLRHPPYYIERHKVGELSDEEKIDVRRRLLARGPSDRVYLCANTPPKIRPEMDGMFRRLLENDSNATIVFLRGEYPPAKTLKIRLQHALGELFDRVIFLPTLGQEDAHSLLLSADCCLDSFPLCGMSSSFDAAMVGVPIVTLPAAIPFGRWTASIYEYIGVSGLTAKSEEEYLQIARRLANDLTWRNELSCELKQKAARFIESAASVGEFAGFVTQAWARHRAGLAPADWIGDRWETRGPATKGPECRGADLNDPFAGRVLRVASSSDRTMPS